MYDRQCLKTDNKEYLAEIKRLLDNRPDDITSPQLVAAFNRLHEKYIGPLPSFKDVKKQYNDLVLSMEDDLRDKLRKSADPLATSLVMSRIGNYIDFAALNEVNVDTFLSLFGDIEMREGTDEWISKVLLEGRNKEYIIVREVWLGTIKKLKPFGTHYDAYLRKHTTMGALLEKYTIFGVWDLGLCWPEYECNGRWSLIGLSHHKDDSESVRFSIFHRNVFIDDSYSELYMEYLGMIERFLEDGIEPISSYRQFDFFTVKKLDLRDRYIPLMHEVAYSK